MLTLTIRNMTQLDNGSPITFVLDKRGAVIGRAPTVEWSLPDPRSHISSRHCEIAYRDGGYILSDISTNGTFLNGSDMRMPAPHRLATGDILLVGHFEIVAALDGAAAAAAAAPPPSAATPEWKGWGASAGSGDASAPPASASGWGAPPPSAAISGAGPMSQNWAPPAAREATREGWAPAAAPPPPPVSSAWGSPLAPSDAPASGWSSAAPDRPPPPSTDDVWGRIADGNVVDWARGGFGQAPSQPAADPLGLAPKSHGFDPLPAAPVAAPAPAAAAPASAPAAPPPAAPQAPARAPNSQDSGAALAALLAAAGLSPTDIKRPDTEALQQAGTLLRRMIAGLVVMLEARARAKAQLGAQSTSLEFDGNNPLKFARAPEQAIAQLLNPAERGFMESDRAIEDAFRDLQAHQVATLKAMQGALRATLDRFSPTAIKTRAEQKGVMAKILPAARDAALWHAYEREFGGVAQGSDEAFMDVFSKEFRKAYEELARSGR